MYGMSDEYRIFPSFRVSAVRSVLVCSERQRRRARVLIFVGNAAETAETLFWGSTIVVDS